MLKNIKIRIKSILPILTIKKNTVILLAIVPNFQKQKTSFGIDKFFIHN